jgi:N-hydroxyarylamine O-acetyltransferase
MERAEIISKYLQALDLEERSPDLTFLSDIARRHVATFAFSSVGCQLGEDLPLDLKSLYQRIVACRRGGYCFEQNGLLYEVLEELGFAVELYLARVIYNQDIHPGLTHRITMVNLDKRQYVVDVGFGPLGPRIPVFMSKQESMDDDRIFRIAEPRSGEFHMQVLKDGDFFSLYRFELVRYGQADCEVGHFYSHKHPSAAFVNHLVVSLLMNDKVRSLRDREYSVITKSGIQKQEISEPDQLRKILVDKFGVLVTEAECQYLVENCL